MLNYQRVYFPHVSIRFFRSPHLARAPSPAPWEAPEATASPAALPVELPTSPGASDRVVEGLWGRSSRNIYMGMSLISCVYVFNLYIYIILFNKI